jgi:hypothetical protein
MNHAEFLAKLVAMKFVLIRHNEGYDDGSQAYCQYIFAGEEKEGIILQGESLEFGPNMYGNHNQAKALLTRVEAIFSVLLTDENYEAMKEFLKDHSRITIQLVTLVDKKVTVNVKVNMGVGTPEDLFNDIDCFRKIGTLQQKWTRNPPMLFGPTYVIDNTFASYKNDPDNMQRQLVQNNQGYIDKAKQKKVYPFDKIVHPGIGTHALY